jgi:lipocalin
MAGYRVKAAGGIVVLEPCRMRHLHGCRRAAGSGAVPERVATQSAKLRVRCGTQGAGASRAPFPSAFVSCLRSEGV